MTGIELRLAVAAIALPRNDGTERNALVYRERRGIQSTVESSEMTLTADGRRCFKRVVSTRGAYETLVYGDCNAFAEHRSGPANENGSTTVTNVRAVRSNGPGLS